MLASGLSLAPIAISVVWPGLRPNTMTLSGEATWMSAIVGSAINTLRAAARKLTSCADETETRSSRCCACAAAANSATAATKRNNTQRAPGSFGLTIKPASPAAPDHDDVAASPGTAIEARHSWPPRPPGAIVLRAKTANNKPIARAGRKWGVTTLAQGLRPLPKRTGGIVNAGSANNQLRRGLRQVSHGRTSAGADRLPAALPCAPAVTVTRSMVINGCVPTGTSPPESLLPPLACRLPR